MKRSCAEAFTLVELAIVLVIIGLIVGGVLVGQSLIRTAELNAVVKEARQFQTAAHTFREKYGGYPGDLKNATAFWGSRGGTGSDAACVSVVSTSDTLTCNGDGDGTIANAISGTPSSEWNRFFQQLGNAGLIEGTYYGYGAAVGTPGITVPKSRLNSTAQWSIRTLASSSTTQTFLINYGNAVMRLRSPNISQTVAGGGVISPIDAWQIDVKMDDGMPGTGKVTTVKGDGVNTFCTSAGGSTTDAGATYVTTNDAKDCVFFDFPNTF